LIVPVVQRGGWLARRQRGAGRIDPLCWIAVARRILVWGAIAALVAVVAFGIVLAIALRPAHIKALVVRGVAEHLHMDAAIDHVEVGLLPRPHISGSGLALRQPHRPDLPPFIRIEHFSVNIGPLSILRKHVNTVYAEGLTIAVPPSDSRGGLPGQNGTGGGMSDVIVDHFITKNAELRFVPRESDDTPLVFAIASLAVDDVGFGLAMPFKAQLTNPVPEGRVDATGRIGPWDADTGSLTPLEGEYTFTHADLSTINGIGGTLESTGAFKGTLTAIDVKGRATVPDFSLDLGGRPQQLTAEFQTVVDGTDGSTTLKRVDATMAKTPMIVTGAIRNLPGPGNHAVDLQVQVDDGRIEDLLALVIDAPKPVMVGDVRFKAQFSLPPGPTRVRNRLKLSGTFGLANTTFTGGQVQEKIVELSRRSQGKDKDDPMPRVVTNLRGRFALANARARLTGLTFQVPGASVNLNGTYGIASGAMDFHGTLTMQASVSDAVGGFKSIFIKPFNRLFRGKHAGAVVPIKITGTRDAPKFGLEVGRIFKKDKK
jgi:hypothetical protein